MIDLRDGWGIVLQIGANYIESIIDFLCSNHLWIDTVDLLFCNFAIIGDILLVDKTLEIIRTVLF